MAGPGSVVPGAHGPHVGVSAASISGTQSNPLVSGRSSHDFIMADKEHAQRQEQANKSWARREKAERDLYAQMNKAQKGLNKNIAGIAADSKDFWKRTSREMSSTLKEMTKLMAKEMTEVSKGLDDKMNKMLSISIARQKKSDEALQAALKTGNQNAIQRAAWSSRNESARLQHTMNVRSTSLKMAGSKREKSALEAKLSMGQTLSVTEYKEYERLTNEVRDLETEMNKLTLINKHLSEGITDLDQAIRAANLDMEYMEKHAKTLEQIISKAKVDMKEWAQKTFSFANAARNAGEAIGMMYKDYNMFIEQMYKMNGAVDVASLSMGKLAMNAAKLQVANAELAVFAAQSNISVEAFNQLKEKMFGAYSMVDKAGNLNMEKYKDLSKEMLNYSRITGASIDESIGLHVKLRQQFGQTGSQASKSMRIIMASQLEARGATARSFSDFQNFSDEYQKSMQSIIDGYEGYKLDIVGVTALFKEQVKISEKLGDSQERAFKLAKGVAGLLTKKSSAAVTYNAGKAILDDVSAQFGGRDNMKQLAINGSFADKEAAISKILGSSWGKSSGFDKQQLNMMLNRMESNTSSATEMEIGESLAGTKAMNIQRMKKMTEWRQRKGTGAEFKALFEQGGTDDDRAVMDRMKYMIDEALAANPNGNLDFNKLSDDLAKKGDAQSPDENKNKFPNVPAWVEHFKNVLDNTAFGKLTKGLLEAGAATAMHTTAMVAHTMALLGSSGKGIIGGAAGMLGKFGSKIPGLGRLFTGGAPRMATGFVGPGGHAVESGAVATARGLKNFGAIGKIASAALLGGTALWGASKLFGDKKDDPTANAEVAAIADGTDAQVEQQKDTNKKLDTLISVASGKGTPGMPTGSSPSSMWSTLGTVGATTAAGGAAAAAAYYGSKALLSKSTVTATAEAAAEVGAKTAGKTLLKSAIPVIGPLLDFALTDGPFGRRLAAAAGGVLVGAAGSAAGTFLMPGAGTLVGGAAGNMAGAYGGTALYDWMTGYNADGSKSDAQSNGAKPSTPEETKDLPGMKSALDDYIQAGAIPAPGTAVPGQPFSSTGLPMAAGQGNAGTGNGTMINVGRDGSATLNATIRLDNFGPSMTTAVRDSYNMQNPSSGMSRHSGWGMPGSI